MEVDYLKENIYSVLLVSSSKSFSDAIIHLLKEKYEPIKLVSSISEASRELLENDYDILIISAPLPDDFGINFAIDSAYKHKNGVLFFVKNDIYDEVYDKTFNYGILTLPKPTSSGVIIQSLKIIEASIEREKMLQEKPLSIKEKLEEIKLINNAKLLLINNMHISENEAHKYIEKRAMFIRKTKRFVAEEIINKYTRRQK